MKTIEELAALATDKWAHFGGDWFACKPPTPESVAHIEKALKISLPRDFVRYCELTPNYGVTFGSIGDDYSSHNHLLKLNEEFHNAGENCFSIPANYILINHGHDDDCE